eukprot:TRINITY_DN3854_c0_g1_i1.p1 TRINITY_DN3854_c0_g1~~TRINITY_DN3854_c0_g1_i1.p1  ORF type:complete len:164 (-),score=30.68 TRINITY_DN3854_c0_g1_i1:181-672(-)
MNQDYRIRDPSDMRYAAFWCWDTTQSATEYFIESGIHDITALTPCYGMQYTIFMGNCAHDSFQDRAIRSFRTLWPQETSLVFLKKSQQGLRGSVVSDQLNSLLQINTSFLRESEAFNVIILAANDADSKVLYEYFHSEAGIATQIAFMDHIHPPPCFYIPDEI